MRGKSFSFWERRNLFEMREIIGMRLGRCACDQAPLSPAARSPVLAGSPLRSRGYGPGGLRRQLFANATIASSRVAAWPCVGLRSSWCPNASVHIQGEPTGAALALKMRPTTTLSSSTSKSSSLHWPDVRLAEARFRINWPMSYRKCRQRFPIGPYIWGSQTTVDCGE
jgi:hypothetical protein